MRIRKSEPADGCVELSVTNFKVKNESSSDWGALSWEIGQLLGNRDFIYVFINKLYIIILDNTDRQGGYDYRVWGRYISLHPRVSVPFCLLPSLPIGDGGTVRFDKDELKSWIREVVERRKGHSNRDR